LLGIFFWDAAVSERSENLGLDRPQLRRGTRLSVHFIFGDRPVMGGNAGERVE
jgi:hypothetical protein